MTSSHSDTAPSAQALVNRLMKEMSPEEKLLRCTSLSSAIRALLMSGIRAEYPDADEAEIRYRFALRCYGPDVARLFLNGSGES